MRKTSDPVRAARYVRNIKRVYRLASREEIINGSLWYPHANLEARGIAQQFGVQSFQRVCAVIAVMSPNCTWEVNLKNAHDLIREHVTGIPPDVGYATYPTNVTKASAIIAGDPIADHLKGPKVTAFYRSIITGGVYREPVIDRHAYALAVGSRSKRLSNPIIRDVAAAYCVASRELGIAVSTLQAITWLVWRRHVNVPKVERAKLKARSTAA